MSDDKKVIMYASDEAAKLTTVTGWVSSDGFFYGKDEHAARYRGSTHKLCECGGIAPRGYVICKECRNKAADKRYEGLKFKEWDFKSPLCLWDGDEYFWDVDGIEFYLKDNDLKPSDLKLLHCTPNYPSEISTENWSEDLPEDSDGELPIELSEKIEEFNKFINSMKPLSYGPSSVRTEYVR